MELGSCVKCGRLMTVGTPYLAPAEGQHGKGIAHLHWCPTIVPDQDTDTNLGVAR